MTKFYCWKLPFARLCCHSESTSKLEPLEKKELLKCRMEKSKKWFEKLIFQESYTTFTLSLRFLLIKFSRSRIRRKSFPLIHDLHVYHPSFFSFDMEISLAIHKYNIKYTTEKKEKKRENEKKSKTADDRRRDLWAFSCGTFPSGNCLSSE